MSLVSNGNVIRRVIYAYSLYQLNYHNAKIVQKGANNVNI